MLSDFRSSLYIVGFSHLVITSAASEEDWQGHWVSCLCRPPPGVRDERLKQDRKYEKGQETQWIFTAKSSDHHRPDLRPLGGSWKYDGAYSVAFLGEGTGAFCWPPVLRCSRPGHGPPGIDQYAGKLPPSTFSRHAASHGRLSNRSWSTATAAGTKIKKLCWCGSPRAGNTDNRCQVPSPSSIWGPGQCGQPQGPRTPQWHSTQEGSGSGLQHQHS